MGPRPRARPRGEPGCARPGQGHDGGPARRLGRLVAFSEVVVPLGAPESAWQHDTLVLREHRGHGLGLATKLANLWALEERYPAVRRISTWNAAENEHMIAVNDAIGFQVAAHSIHWLKQLEG